MGGKGLGSRLKEIGPSSLAKRVEGTPMMEQYTQLKAINPGFLLFYRLGDFYELFFEDAEIASRALGIALTKRGQHAGQDVPMCGVPVHASEEYLHRLIRQGHRVAICEQVETPSEARKRGSKSIVERDIVRLVTPGTVTEEGILDARRSNYLASLSRLGSADGYEFGLAWLDLSTGGFRVATTDMDRLDADLARIGPAELLIPEGLMEEEGFRGVVRLLELDVTELEKDRFDSSVSERFLRKYFDLGSEEILGPFDRAQYAAAGVLVDYLDRTQIGHRPALSRPCLEHMDGILRIDATTRASLELLRTSRGEVSGSLLSVMDRTVTASGGRLLLEDLSSPLVRPDEIRGRLDAVSYFCVHEGLRDRIREALKTAGDQERALSRLALGRGGPRDMRAIIAGLETAAAVEGLLQEEMTRGALPGVVRRTLDLLAALNRDVLRQLKEMLADEVPMLVRDGGFIRDGYSRELDEVRMLRDESRRFIVSLQARYAEETGIRSLKIKHNNMLGYFVEVGAQQGAKLLEAPLKETFIHRQTMVNDLRLSTVELGDLESRIAGATERALLMEKALFEEMREVVVEQGAQIKRVALGLARLDVSASLSVLAQERGYVRPEIDESLSFRVEGGKHPVIDGMGLQSGNFVGNDCELGATDEECYGRILLITGPNMAGKSTFLRQNALIAIMAQMGSFVPARSARIGVVDYVFSRVGAADDLARGRSTFMVEMLETATILRQATIRSLVILDEVGRGTATYDGLSIAWACLEYLHNANKCRTMFATHYHELTRLGEILPRLDNVHVKVHEWEGKLVFLHEVVSGSASRSYGVHVARCAGLPESVTDRADKLLEMLEMKDSVMNGAYGEHGRYGEFVDVQVSIRGSLEGASGAVTSERDGAVTERKESVRSRKEEKGEAVRRCLEEIDPDELSPKEALQALYRLKEVATQG